MEKMQIKDRSKEVGKIQKGKSLCRSRNFLSLLQNPLNLLPWTDSFLAGQTLCNTSCEMSPVVRGMNQSNSFRFSHPVIVPSEYDHRFAPSSLFRPHFRTKKFYTFLFSAVRKATNSLWTRLIFQPQLHVSVFTNEPSSGRTKRRG